MQHPWTNRCRYHLLHIGLLLVLFFVNTTHAQTTAFTYQGKLTDAGNPANAAYDMQFKLFDALVNGNQIGATLTFDGTGGNPPSVSVTNGIFTVSLDFGASVFTGMARYLEISVRPAGSPNPYTVLAPRQLITSSPYAIRTISATSADALSSACVACVQDAQINSIAGSKVNGLIPVVSVPAGSANYVQNTTSQQAGANFNISGNGTAGSLNANGAFSLGGIAPPAPVAGQGRIYFDSASNKVKVSENGGAFVNLVGASGVSGSGTTNTIPMWSAGTTLGNSLITQSNGAIQLPNSVQLAAGAQGYQVQFGSPNGETGMVITGTNRADVRFDGSTLKLLAGLNSTAPCCGIAIDTFGNVGIGTFAPAQRLTVQTATSNYGFTHTDGNIIVGSFVGGGTGGGWYGTKTAHPLSFFTNDSSAQMTLNTAGNVGIGTTAPAHRLSLIGGPAWTSAGWTGAVELGNGSAIGWRANAAGSRFGIGQTNGGLYFFGTGSDPGTTGSPAVYDMVINDNGNITQPINANGLVKAMLVVDEFGTIVRCYNGITNTSSGNCGFMIGFPTSGVLRINFNFPVSGRFVSVTAQYVNTSGQGLNNSGANYRFFDATSIEVFTFISGNSADTTSRPFTLILY